MTHTHLSPDDWKVLLEGEGDPPEGADTCPHCEETLGIALAALRPDALDGEVDDLLLAARPGDAPPRPDEVGFARFWRARPGARRRRRMVAATVLSTTSALAAVAATLLIMVNTTETPYRDKGSGSVLPDDGVRLSLVQRRGDDLVPVSAGNEHRIGEALFFRVELAGEGCVTLWVDEGEGPEALLDNPACLPAGGAVLERDGEALGFVPDRDGPLHLGVTTDGAVPKTWVTVRVVR